VQPSGLWFAERSGIRSRNHELSLNSGRFFSLSQGMDEGFWSFALLYIERGSGARPSRAWKAP
jgi:hypothetical protein